ncbi:MAG: hypothetical protein U0Y68_06190 [Blastocatellia bacterium]
MRSSTSGRTLSDEITPSLIQSHYSTSNWAVVPARSTAAAGHRDDNSRVIIQ